MSEQQNYKNHTRFFPLVHYVLFPVFLFNLIWQSVRMYQEPSWDRAESILMALAFIALSVAARMQALKAQDRVIRLEEKLRYREVLSADLAEKAQNLRASQMIALRFASDGELAELVEKTLKGEFATPKDIKLAIKDWRGDHFRV